MTLSPGAYFMATFKFLISKAKEHPGIAVLVEKCWKIFCYIKKFGVFPKFKSFRKETTKWF